MLYAPAHSAMSTSSQTEGVCLPQTSLSTSSSSSTLKPGSLPPALTQAGLRVAAVDIGGTTIKAAVINRSGMIVSEHLSVPSPTHCDGPTLVDTIAKLLKPFDKFNYQCVSIGFPGVVKSDKEGTIVTAPNLSPKGLTSFPLAKSVAEHLHKPVKVINDADMQGLASIKGRGVEMVITLGTGFGSALFKNGVLSSHLEVGQTVFVDSEFGCEPNEHNVKHTYDTTFGKRGFESLVKQWGEQKGFEIWKERLVVAIENLRVLTNFETLYIGGGLAQLLKEHGVSLGKDIVIVDNVNGLRGGVKLWTNPTASFIKSKL